MTSQTSTWRLPIALVALAAIPVIAGSLRLIDLSTGSTVMPLNPRFSASPLPVVIHIVSAMVFALLGAFQFSARLRRRHRAWHRRAGRIVMLAGLGVGLSALWLNQFFPRAGAAPPPPAPPAGGVGWGGGGGLGLRGFAPAPPR